LGHIFVADTVGRSTFNHFDVVGFKI